MIVCRAWKASAPRLGGAFEGSLSGAAFVAGKGGRMEGKSFAGPYHVNSMGGEKASTCAERIFHTGGGNKMTSTWQATATANAARGERWSIQQSLKYGSPRNCFGAAGPPRIARTFEKNSSYRPIREIANSGECALVSVPGLELRSLPDCFSRAMCS